jgi:hypothetical protein
MDQNGIALQTALDSAQPGDLVIVPAGFTYRVNSLMLRNKSGSGWITIASSSTTRLPPEGSRVAPANRIQMPLIVSPGGNQPVILTEPGAHNYRLTGLEITKLDPQAYIQELVVIDAQNGTDPAEIQNRSDFPNNIIIDRCYIHGLPGSDLKRGIRLHCVRCAVVDSYISDAHVVGQDSQAILFGGQIIKITNNFLQGAAENVFGAGVFSVRQSIPIEQPTITSAQLGDTQDLEIGMGLSFYDGDKNLYTTVRDISGRTVTYDQLPERPSGASKAYWGLIPTDVEISHNYLSKPAEWNPSDPSYAGYHPTVKNLFELKAGRRIWFHDNILERSWVDAQTGYAVLFTVRNESGNCYFCAVEDVTFERNIIRNALFGMDMGRTDNLAPSGPTRRVLVRNNLWTEIGSSLQICGLDDLIVDHNTAIVGAFAESIDSGEWHPGNVFINNILVSFRASGFHYPEQVNWDEIFPGWQLKANIMSRVDNMSPYLFMPPALALGNYEIDDPMQIGFVDWAGKNYALSNDSWARGKALDGTDLGADVALLASNEVAIIEGNTTATSSAGSRDFGSVESFVADSYSNGLGELYLDPTSLADPNRPTTINIDGETSLGVANLVWSAPSADIIEIHVGSPSGPLMVRDGPQGRAATGTWVQEGTMFYLQDRSQDHPLDERFTLAWVKVHTRVQVPNIAESASFYVDPATLPDVAQRTTIAVQPGQICGTAYLIWDAPTARIVEIHVGSPDGPLMARVGNRGKASTGAWVVDGMSFYLQDRTDGKPLDSAGTLSKLIIHLASSDLRLPPQVYGLAAFYLDQATIPDPAEPTTILVPAGALGVAHVVWNAPQARVVEVHVGAPDGPLFAAGSSKGSAVTGIWVRDGTIFYLQDRSNGLSLNDANTLGVMVVHTTSAVSRSM